ncbi:tail fiber assembly protein [Lelliottia nimipressuralis]|uniref:tail fiber assembly protein n=1 Tax=Lelliottia nimipressuralis TaxID=69220 RepID=UPI00289C6558|nr:tail fiber assembly protein [Lelliottia nimipressuralis]
MEFIRVLDAVYASQAGDVIDCQVEIEGLGLLPFSASKNDPELHGQQLYEALISGKWGDIAAYTPPNEEEVAGQIAAAAQALKTERFAEATAMIDSLQFAVDAGEATGDEVELLARWQQYRLAVMRAKPTAEGLVLPEKPDDVEQ